jgi:hypothetical protein
VEVVATTETESTALAVDGRQVKLGCLVHVTTHD